MAQQPPQDIEYIPVKAEDVMPERMAMYDGFMRSIPIAGGITVAILVFLYIFWG
jgi:hypothetical protein